MSKKPKKPKNREQRRQENRRNNSIPTGKSETNPKPIIEKAKEYPSPIPPKSSVKNPRQYKKIKKYFLMISAVLSVVYGILKIQPYLHVVPVIEPKNYESAGPVPIRFTIHNPSSIVMYDVQIASILGPGIFNGKPDELTPPFKFHSGDPCQKLRNYRDFDLAHKDNLLIKVIKPPLINPNDSVTFDPDYIVDSARQVVGIAVRHNLKPFGIIPLWPLFDCNKFQTYIDPNGHIRIDPL
jgi:hypothetical protein